MIQRIQSVWLLLASIASLLTFEFSFYSGYKIGNTVLNDLISLTASSNLLLIILAALTGIGSFIAIFLFKDRKTQLRITIMALILSVLSLVVYFSQIKNYEKGHFSLTAIFALLIPILLFLAVRGIYKDQKLVKSLDRLR
ncbi:MAG: DUF4293 domain-containing protein [Bacteroidetes bacterium]|nr:DUF4293 domain-containing protein [Bacteroidota bacterium]